MKNFKHYIALITIIIAFQANAQTFKTANDYLTFISDQQELVTKNMWKYTKAVAHSKSPRSISGKRNTLLKSMQRGITKIEKAQGFEGDDYKNKVLTHMRLNENLLKQDYAKIIDLKEVAEQSYDFMEAYILAQELADKKMAEAQEQYEKDFYAFAAKHNINIIESESDLGKKMKISNQVFDHKNDLYLVFFKVYINEVYLWEAIETGDINAIQQNSNALKQTATEGLEILKEQKLYKNDKAIVVATKATFDFFIDEATNKIPQLTDFLILNEDLKSIKATLDKTPEKKRTKAQIDGFNKKVKAVNKKLDAYNKTNNALNLARQKVLNRLNNTNANFLSRHIPKD
ncbi:hypothetical protein [Olleya sp. R77988]|uniref:hypothetical protein n=1 Tax=Olleya sp. R77988 TaxID=3093875 RepID=UPI0037C5B6C7